jgi:uncharacterized membrane protein
MPKVEEETKRLEAFSDGVFAFAITLLALNLKTPELGQIYTNAGLWKYLLGEWPMFLSFITSFLSVLIMWINHRGIFRQIYRINGQLMFANGFMLLMVITVPFTTSLLSQYYMTTAANTAAAIYSGTFVLINISYNLLWYTASSSNQLLRQGVTEETVSHIRKNYLIGFPSYMVAFIVSFFNVELTIIICIGLWIFWAAMMRVF